MWSTSEGKACSAWQASYTDASGRRRTKQFVKKREAEIWLSQTRVEVVDGTHVPERVSISIAEMADKWLGRLRQDGRERSTLKSYEEIVRLHLAPRLGWTLVSKLTRSQVEHWCDHLSASRSKATAKKSLVALKALLNEAVRLGFAGRNVASSVRVKIAARERQALAVPSRDELRRLLDAAEGPIRCFLLLAITCGLRSSELRGLQWGDIDLARRLVHVRRRADQWNVLGPPKSAAGVRTIPLPVPVCLELETFRGACRDGDLVFASSSGTPISPSNLARRMFKPLQLRAGVFALHRNDKGAPVVGSNGEWWLTGKYKLHALRHAAASNWIAAGVDLKRLQVWLGHSSVQMTIDRYGHLMRDEHRDAELVNSASQDLLDS